MRNTLSRFESRVEQFVEGTVSRWFGQRLSPREVLIQLARAMEDQSSPGANGEAIAPTTFTVRMNPADAQPYQDPGPLVAELQQGLIELARDAGMLLLKPPLVRILPDESVPVRGLAVECVHDGATDTQSMTPVGQAGPELEPPPGAYLILNGETHIPLDRAMITIGRRLSNHIILDDTRVSRAHAQLRLRHGRYVLYDLGSKTGTRVNDRLVAEWVLRPGDVIAIADSRLIYAEEGPTVEPGASTGFTQPFAAIPPPDRTARTDDS